MAGLTVGQLLKKRVRLASGMSDPWPRKLSICRRRDPIRNNAHR
jgi:hypothetical protein